MHAAVRLAEQTNALNSARAPRTTQSSEDADMTDSNASLLPSFTDENLHSLISSFLSSHDRAIREVEKERRPGRPKSREHERLEAEKSLAEKEYESGFWMVDLRKPEVVKKFTHWSGLWEGLGNLEYVRVRQRREGEGWESTVVGSKFPPTGGD
ncbi:GPI ethanolamine phosphate transferase 3 [Sphaceloma murrayae]|uniref:GPI ethanolamine phosphate transferase 3 n=1 Tax=Sphaceloma murrayae TaxID=2082308 RepID=A0A2K1R3Q9_9PEZI|nr:GPI ethanolamine phosphate transferase 3 [Sphaceloma murrayae]